MQKRLGAVLPIIGLLVLMPNISSAQQRSAPLFEESTAVSTPQSNAYVADVVMRRVVQEPQAGQEMKPEEQASTSGFFLGIISMLAGSTIGSTIGQSDCPPKAEDKDCRSHYAYTGALIAGSIAIPLGVHLATKEKHNLGLSLALSAAAGGLLYLGTKAIPGEPIAMAPFMALPIQVLTSVKMERRK